MCDTGVILLKTDPTGAGFKDAFYYALGSTDPIHANRINKLFALTDSHSQAYNRDIDGVCGCEIRMFCDFLDVMNDVKSGKLKIANKKLQEKYGILKAYYDREYFGGGDMRYIIYDPYLIDYRDMIRVMELQKGAIFYIIMQDIGYNISRLIQKRHRAERCLMNHMDDIGVDYSVLDFKEEEPDPLIESIKDGTIIDSDPIIDDNVLVINESEFESTMESMVKLEVNRVFCNDGVSKIKTSFRPFITNTLEDSFVINKLGHAAYLNEYNSRTGMNEKAFMVNGEPAILHRIYGSPLIFLRSTPEKLFGRMCSITYANGTIKKNGEELKTSEVFLTGVFKHNVPRGSGEVITKSPSKIVRVSEYTNRRTGELHHKRRRIAYYRNKKLTSSVRFLLCTANPDTPASYYFANKTLKPSNAKFSYGYAACATAYPGSDFLRPIIVYRMDDDRLTEYDIHYLMSLLPRIRKNAKWLFIKPTN